MGSLYLATMKVASLLVVSTLLATASAQGTTGFNKLIAMELPLINTNIQKVMPASYGNCGASTASGPAPAPCHDTGADLFKVHKSWAYRAEARWISGLNSITFDSIVLANTTGALDGLQANGHFASLPTSIHIEQCVTFDMCTKLWDNTGACCGNNKHFSFTVGIACDTATHGLKDMGLKGLTIDQFEVTESIAGIDLPSEDITDPVHAALVQVLSGYLAKPFISNNGTEETLVQYLNDAGSYYVSQLC